MRGWAVSAMRAPGGPYPCADGRFRRCEHQEGQIGARMGGFGDARTKELKSVAALGIVERKLLIFSKINTRHPLQNGGGAI